MARSKRVQVINTLQFKKQLRKAIDDAIEEKYPVDDVLRDVEQLVRSLYEKTLQHWEGGEGVKSIPNHSDKTRTEPNPPTIKIKVDRHAKGATIEAHVDSYIWNLLDQGRGTRVTKKIEKFVGRDKKRPRTIPGTLDVSNQRYYTEVVYIPKETTVDAIKPRGWTDVVLEEAEEELVAKYPHIEFSFTTKE